ncbi:MAG: MucB/RseB C-terminal domain-containing protein [Pseudomonadota bacterium]|nr:MucB/RseB C-terminal domain-containing protein [Pseudomonadota bacterium]
MISSICRSVVLVLVISAVTVPGAERSALEWLDVMNRAFRTLDYDGVFSYQSGAGLTTLRLVHVVIDGIEHERIIHLDGARREFVRRGREITRILQPKDKILELEKAVPPTPFVQAFSSRLDAIGDVYKVELNGSGRVAGRRAIRLRIVPRDEDRYGVGIWLDHATGLLLRYERYDLQGSRLEGFQFGHLTIGDIPRTAVIPEEHAGAVTTKWKLESRGEFPVERSMHWRPQWVPRGFDRYRSNISPAMRDRDRVDATIYTDGFATFSVFVQAMPNRRVVNFERRNGATALVTRTLQGPMGKNQLVTVVGEVPAATARKIATDMLYLR